MTVQNIPMSLAMIVIVTQPDEAARVVVIATFAATLAALAESIRVDPQLNPYHPNQRMRVPSAIIVGLDGGIGTGLPSTKRPVRGPTMIAPIKPATPPTMCTIPDPAKSIIPREVSLPDRRGRALPSASGMAPHAERKPDPQPQWTTTG